MSNGDTTTASLNSMFETLADATRRRVLLALTDDAPLTVRTLARRVEPDSRVSSTRTALRHHHLPTLERHGFVWWERADGTVGRGSRWSDVRSILDAIEYPTERTVPA